MRFGEIQESYGEKTFLVCEDIYVSAVNTYA